MAGGLVYDAHMNGRLRLITALGIAVVLSTVMIYTALSGSASELPVLQASELAADRAAVTNELIQIDGIAAGPVSGDKGRDFTFYVTDRAGKNRTKVAYSGSVPDAFRVGRNVILKGRLAQRDGEWVLTAQRNSLVTKCPSKFESDGGSSRSSS